MFREQARQALDLLEVEAPHFYDLVCDVWFIARCDWFGWLGWLKLIAIDGPNFSNEPPWLAGSLVHCATHIKQNSADEIQPISNENDVLRILGYGA